MGGQFIHKKQVHVLCFVFDLSLYFSNSKWSVCSMRDFSGKLFSSGSLPTPPAFLDDASLGLMRSSTKDKDFGRQCKDHVAAESQ